MSCGNRKFRDLVNLIQRFMWTILAIVLLFLSSWLGRDWLLQSFGGFACLFIIVGWLLAGCFAWAGSELTAYLLGLGLMLMLMAGCTDPEAVARARQVDGSTNATATAVAISAPATATAVAVKAGLEVETADEREAFYSAAWDGGRVAILVLGSAGLICVIWVMLARARADARHADLRARTLQVPRDTRLLPLLISPDGQHVTNLNTGESRPLWEVREPHLPLLAADSHVRELGIMVDGAVAISQSTGQGDGGEVLQRGWVVLGGEVSSGLALPSPNESGRNIVIVE